MKPIRTGRLRAGALAGALAATASVVAGAETYVADLSVIPAYSWNLEKTVPFHYPFLSVFKDVRKTLAYVASDHQSGVASTTFKTVKKAFDRTRPQVIVVEGLAAVVVDEDSRKSYLGFLDRCAAEKFTHCDEPAYSAWLAQRAGIPFTTGEPLDAQVRVGMERAGYSANDLAAYYVLRMVPQLRRHGEVKADGFDDWASPYLKTTLKRIGAKSHFAYADFKAWYERRNAAKKPIFEIDFNDLAPISNPSATPLQKISAKVNVIREEAILREIVRQLNAHDRVLVVYGGSHLTTERPVLEKLLGKAEDSKPY